MGTQPLRLPCCHLEGQLQEKGRRRFARGLWLLCTVLPLLWHRGSPCCPGTRTCVLSIERVPGAVKHETRLRLADPTRPLIFLKGTAIHPSAFSRGMNGSFSVSVHSVPIQGNHCLIRARRRGSSALASLR